MRAGVYKTMKDYTENLECSYVTNVILQENRRIVMSLKNVMYSSLRLICYHPFKSCISLMETQDSISVVCLTKACAH